MCGKYYIDEETAAELQKIVKDLDQKFAQGKVKRDVRPTDLAPILTWEDERFQVKEARWGFTSPFQKSPVFNARVESVDTKPMFKDRLEYGRCLVPAAGFYEWSRTKEKYQFFLKEKPLMLMGGLYRLEEETQHFTILTKDSMGSIAQIHERMPIIFSEPSWLHQKLDLEELKHQEVFLEKYIENEQIKFDFS
jgi:putative SOS response-associated peptidase YedK